MPRKKAAEPELPKTQREMLAVQAHKRQDYLATHSYDTVNRTCMWCLTVHPDKYALGWGNKFTRNAYDSEECRANDAIWRGWKPGEVEDAEE